MVQLPEIQAVQHRIQQIQQRFGMPQQTVPGQSFQETLEAQMAGGLQSPSQPKAVGGVEKSAVKSVKTPAAMTEAERAFQEAGGTHLSGSVNDMIRSAASKYGIDPRLVSAVAEAESGGNQDEISSAGAIGIMQLMPGTAASLGVNPYDAAQNIEGGTKYLHDMLDTFGGDVRKAVAAYNAGPGAVKAYGGVPPYPETQAYVNRVLDLYR